MGAGAAARGGAVRPCREAVVTLDGRRSAAHRWGGGLVASAAFCCGRLLCQQQLPPRGRLSWPIRSNSRPGLSYGTKPTTWQLRLSAPWGVPLALTPLGPPQPPGCGAGVVREPSAPSPPRVAWPQLLPPPPPLRAAAPLVKNPSPAPPFTPPPQPLRLPRRKQWRRQRPSPWTAASCGTCC